MTLDLHRMRRGALRAALRAAWRAAPLALVVFVAACSSGKDAAKPASLTDIRGAVAVRAAWRVSLDSAKDAFLQPAVLEDAVYAAGGDGTLVRIDPASGHVVWRVKTGSKLSAGVGSDGSVVVVATARGTVLAFGADGRPLWTAQVTSDVAVPPLVGRGLVAVRSTDHRVAAFSSDAGKRLWTYQRPTPPPLSLRVPTPLAFSGESVIAGFPGGRLVAIALSNGAMRWEATVSEPNGATEVERLSDVIGGVAVGADDLCAASYQGRVLCVDAASANEHWTRPLAAGAGVGFDAERVFAVDQSAAVLAFSRGTGASLWRNTALANRKLSTPLAHGGWIAVGDLKGYVHFLSVIDGSLIGRASTDGAAIVVAPQSWSNGAVVQSRGGAVELLVPGGA
jgi:outer membrane protein assembly factor BamB